eukprot:GFUD01033285.1.p1 GENE.GFUD01033285.1~~GFUD01033285.1.p1  ORF type:complete len:299 (+),score=101.70 GFUD01033285.1:70-966(+)
MVYVGDAHGRGDQVDEQLVEEDLLLFHLPVVYYPLFDVAHFVCAALQLRKEHGQQFGRQHPVSSCVAMLSSSFAGSLLASLALGLPAVSPLQREDKVLLAVVVWLAVFFSPLDVVHRLLTNRTVFTLVSVMKEVYRVRKIVRGISLAQSHYPASKLIPFIVGVLKGNGSGLLKPLTRLICGVWTPSQSELLTPSQTTRCCAVAALAWLAGSLLVTQDQLDRQSGQLLYSSLVLLFVISKVEQSLDLTGQLLRLLECVGLKHTKDEENLKHTKDENLKHKDEVNQVNLVLNNNVKNKED